jgi:hypothetical protein
MLIGRSTTVSPRHSTPACAPSTSTNSGEEWAVEIKRSLTPTPERGFHSALADLKPQRALIVYPGTDSYRLAPPIEAISLAELCKQAQARRT